MLRAGRHALLALALAAAGVLLPSFALRWARPAVLDFGPNDADYVRGFRQDWERDGQTRFRWTSQAANVTLPLRVSGQGPLLRLRFRRHFIEPANVRLTIEGRTVAAFEVQADPKVAYRELEIPLPPLKGRHPFVLSIEAPSEIPRPLGLAMDWLELDRRPGTRFAFLPPLLIRLACAVAAAFLLPLLAGGPRWLGTALASGLVAAATFGAAHDVLALERIARLGSPVFAVVGALALLAAKTPACARRLGIDSRQPAVAGALVVGVLVALAVRLGLLLHPQFFYPDVRVHAAFALLLARRGIESFSADFIANQFRLSLGLQELGDHWYALPYPPGFYLLASPLIAWVGYRPEVAVSALAAAVNSLEVLLVFAIGRRIGLAAGPALAGSAFVPLLPLFLARLSLGYFPALFGHAFDALLIAALLGAHRRLPAPRPVAVLALLLALSFLAYTQSLLNFAVLVSLLTVADVAGGGPPALRRAGGLALACLLGGLLAFGLFYWRYVPMLEALRQGAPVPEEQILRDRFAQEDRARSAVNEAAVPEEPDPYAGPGFDLLRGIRKAGWRLYVFYGPFAPIVFAAFLLLARSVPRESARFVWAWGLTYLALNVLSGSLPGPNLVRYNKDLEIVAPLACLALGAVHVRLWSDGGKPGKLLALAGGAAWILLGASRAVEYLSRSFGLER